MHASLWLEAAPVLAGLDGFLRLAADLVVGVPILLVLVRLSYKVGTEQTQIKSRLGEVEKQAAVADELGREQVSIRTRLPEIEARIADLQISLKGISEQFTEFRATRTDSLDKRYQDLRVCEGMHDTIAHRFDAVDANLKTLSGQMTEVFNSIRHEARDGVAAGLAKVALGKLVGGESAN